MKHTSPFSWRIFFVTLGAIGGLVLFVALLASLFPPSLVADITGNGGTLTLIKENTTLSHGSIIYDLIPAVIRMILSVFSILLTGAALYSGVLFVGNFGDEEAITKAKKLLIWSLVGVVVSAVSYAVVVGVLHLF